MGLGRFFRTSAQVEEIDFRRLLLMCLIVGLVAGLGAAGFFVMLDAGSAFFMGYLAHFHPAPPGWEKPLFHFGPGDGLPIRWLFLIIPMLGGLVSGLITFTFAPEAEGHGTDAAIEAYHFKDGSVRARVPLVKSITSMITIGTGGSGGREGPIAQIGSGFGSVLGHYLKLSPNERRILMAAGMSAGIGAIFHAPLAGALFAAEVLYRGPDLEYEVVVPAFVTSIVAYCTFGVFFGWHPLLVTPNYAFNQVSLLAPYLLLGIISAGGAWLFTRTFYGVRGFMFKRLHIPNHLKPAIGGGLTGLIGFFLPEALGAGYGVVQACFNNDVAGVGPTILELPTAAAIRGILPAGMAPGLVGAVILGLIALAKIGTTAASIGSGGSGGVFGPAVVIGAALGGSTGLLFQHFFTSLAIQPGAFALVGMAGFFAGAANTPISTIIMVSEMTGNYKLLLPAMLVCMVSYLLCQRFSLYEKQLPSRMDAPSKLGTMARAILRRLTVGNAVRRRPDAGLVVVPESMTLKSLVDRYVMTTQLCFPVVDEEGRLTGVIAAQDIRRTLTEVQMAELVIAADIAVPATTLTADESLLTAINHMVRTEREELVVVDGADNRRIIGTVSRGDIIAEYNRQIVSSTVPTLG
ncbi:MAG TPA: chloride channel protein [Phycisphaerae bacterium]|nr:chloride channel protein [Phycisphaerales bacterium]HRX83427.1 chloride channel protein [Phycisphaerae bacterium]